MTNEDDLIEFVVDSVELDDLDASALDEDLAGASTSDDTAPELDDEPDELEDPVSAALTPGVPLFLIHKSHQYAGILPRVLADIAQRHAGALHLGVVAPMPRMRPPALRTFLDGMSEAPLRIADPEAFARNDSFGPTLTAQREKPFVGPSTASYWNYFTDPQVGGHTQAWVEEVLDAQRQAGATVLLTPGLWADPATPDASLAVMRQHAVWAHTALSPAEHLAVNMTIPANWLTTPSLRNRLLDEVIDMDDEVFYLRVRWPLLGQAYGQLVDEAILDGYAEVANVFEENDKVLILPNSGMTGWAALALGAHGFSTGIGSGERAFADTRVIRIKRTGPRPAATRRTFSTSILHVIDDDTAKLLDALGPGSCRCRFCRTQRRHPAGRWEKDLAGAHYLRRVADLTADISRHSRGRRVAARSVVRNARSFVTSSRASVPLSGTNDPKHLALWADLLR
ncbi:hypothetical protein [Rhodococcus qingshengii]|uniref:hypothetical protein n=2 Tax=Rhodococcus TaxID=1827 RepID=UPI0006424B78|nr:hypothetical protein [Rhodococcus qingshengii]KLN71601.1 hypothetical protein ABM90_11190 [Rhodococcus erythropolis]KSU59986.1 hypothetical protein AS032_34420 [Rhodococcus qingshengii]SCC70480.1 hypothetical protein GA0061093_1478 [Rhodococcus qingshengii]